MTGAVSPHTAGCALSIMSKLCMSMVQVKGSVESGIEYLLQKREADPYRDPLPRWLYEAASGGKPAPTFRL